MLAVTFQARGFAAVVQLVVQPVDADLPGPGRGLVGRGDQRAHSTPAAGLTISGTAKVPASRPKIGTPALITPNSRSTTCTGGAHTVGVGEEVYLCLQGRLAVEWEGGEFEFGNPAAAAIAA